MEIAYAFEVGESFCSRILKLAHPLALPIIPLGLGHPDIVGFDELELMLISKPVSVEYPLLEYTEDPTY